MPQGHPGHTTTPTGFDTCAYSLSPRPRLLQEKRSAYAPSEETPVRYDGIYRIAKCWRKPGEQVRMGGGILRVCVWGSGACMFG